MVDLDHAATTRLRPEALEAMLPYLREGFGNASGAYALGRAARAAVDRAREQVARAVGASAHEIVFTSGGTESDNWAVFGAARAAGWGSRVVASAVEHHAVLRACEALRGDGYDAAFAAVDGEGRLCLDSLRALAQGRTALVSVMLANNEVGTIQPVREAAQIAHACGALMHTDAVQAVGHIPVDVDALDVDLLSMSAHKFGGPKGVGALYVREGTRLARLIFGGEQERGLRAGTENVPGIVGMGVALTAAVREMDEASRRVTALRDALTEALLARIPGARLNGSREHRLPGNVHVTIPGADARALLIRLDMAGIAASSGSACASGAAERSHVLEAMAAPPGADLRLTLGADNTPEDVRRAVSALCAILNV